MSAKKKAASPWGWQAGRNRFKENISVYSAMISHSSPFSAEADRHLRRLPGHPPYLIRGVYDPEVVK